MKEQELWVPYERVQPILDEYKDSYAVLSASTQRRIYNIKTGRQKYVSLSVVDTVLIDMGLDEWLRYRKEDGGLADIYEDGEQYGSPHGDRPRAPEPTAEEKREQEERRRAQYRESARKRAQFRAELVPVACRECGEERNVQRWYAKRAATQRCRGCVGREVGQMWVAERAKRLAA